MRWSELSRLRARAVVLAEGKLGELTGKTCNILVMYSGWRRVTVRAVIDSRYSGQDAGEVLGVGLRGVKVYGDLETALRECPDIDTLIVGISPVGGRLPGSYREVIKAAIMNGLNVWSGLHIFLSRDPEISSLASKYNVEVVDFRLPPPDLRVWTGEVLRVKAPRVLVAGTDCSVGKNVTCIELTRSLEKAGVEVGLVGTGQTMLMVGADAGTVVDAVPADFVSGEVERHVTDLSQLGRQIIVVEGQASLLHPAYSQVTLGIYYGALPNMVILCHDPWRATRESFDNIPMPSLEQEVMAVKAHLPEANVAAVSVMGYRRSPEDVQEACSKIERLLGIPAADPLREPDKLRDAVLELLEKNKLV